MKPIYKKDIRLLNSHSANSANKNDAKTGDSFLKILVTVISLAGVALTLIGYGVTLHRAAMFGLDVTEIGRSPMDFLVSSTDFVVVVIGSFREIIELAISEPEIIFVGAGVGICFVVFYAIYRGFLRACLKTQNRPYR